MDIKVGDRVRIKSKEQLLKDNWTEKVGYLVSDFTALFGIDLDDCGRIMLIEDIDYSDDTFRTDRRWFDICVIDEIVEDAGNYEQLQEENNRLQNAYDLIIKQLQCFKDENERLYKMKRDLEDYAIEQGWQEYVGEENKKTIWHKVADDDLPEKGKRVLCYTRHNDYTTGCFTHEKSQGDAWDLDNDMCYREPQWVIAWTELPKYEGVKV